MESFPIKWYLEGTLWIYDGCLVSFESCFMVFCKNVMDQFDHVFVSECSEPGPRHLPLRAKCMSTFNAIKLLFGRPSMI